MKAKLEAIDSGIYHVRAAHFVVPGGGTFGQSAIPQIDEAGRTGKCLLWRYRSGLQLLALSCGRVFMGGASEPAILLFSFNH